MDRFAFKIDKALKANLYKICRLCGIDNPDQVPIIKQKNNTATINVDDDPEISQKIKELIGFIVTKDDKMPQNICSLCMDKLNDFYEFREMCYATNVQTRRLLGLKIDDPRKACIEVKIEAEVKEEKTSVPNSTKKLSRKRKSDDDAIMCPEKKLTIDVRNVKTVSSLHKKMKVPQKVTLVKKATTRSTTSLKDPKIENLGNDSIIPIKEEIKQESPQDTIPAGAPQNKEIPSSQSKLKELCNICDQRFSNKIKLQQHKKVIHVPNIPRYVCSTCNENYNKSSDIKTHQLWHKLTRTPYTCSLCKESMASAYVFARHLREHCPQQVPAAMLVLDRECPQCHEKFITNFFYNTHSCAIQTKKCPGCKRKQKTEEEYLKHIPFCPKSFLNHSKFIKSKQGTVAETFVPIKNENDIEAAEAAASLGLNFDITPVVSLTRLPEISEPLTSNQDTVLAKESPSHIDSLADNRNITPNCSKNKKHSKHSGTKEHIKRIDDLLKSTLDALVSIKHEPEVNMETEIQTENKSTVDSNVVHVDNDAGSDRYELEHFENHIDEDSDAEHSSTTKGDSISKTGSSISLESSLNVKLEPGDINLSPESNSLSVAIKIKDEPNEPAFSGEKMPTLKLKIRKEHGKLNSSLVDDQEITREKKKKKKKRKEMEKERENEKFDDEKSTENQSTECTVPPKSCDPILIRIKQEPNENSDNNRVHHSLITSASVFSQPTLPVMTSIPMVQLQMACAANEVALINSDFCIRKENNYEKESMDIKPNLAELDNLMQITNVTSIAEMPPENITNEYPTEENLHHSPNKKARNAFLTVKNTSSSDVSFSVPKIASVATLSESGENTFALHNVVIKTEPLDSGFSEPISSSDSVNDDNISEVLGNEKITESELEIIIKKECFDSNDEITEKESLGLSSKDEEQKYIESIDFSQLQIKQEEELDLFDAGNIEKISCSLPVGNNLTSKHSSSNKTMSREMESSEKNVVSSNEKICKKSLNSKERQFSSDSECTNDYSETPSETETEDEIIEEEEESREYREMEEPPLLDLSINKVENENFSIIPENTSLKNDQTSVKITGPISCPTSVESESLPKTYYETERDKNMSLKISNISSAHAHSSDILYENKSLYNKLRLRTELFESNSQELPSSSHSVAENLSKPHCSSSPKYFGLTLKPANKLLKDYSVATENDQLDHFDIHHVKKEPAFIDNKYSESDRHMSSGNLNEIINPISFQNHPFNFGVKEVSDSFDFPVPLIKQEKSDEVHHDRRTDTPSCLIDREDSYETNFKTEHIQNYELNNPILMNQSDEYEKNRIYYGPLNYNQMNIYGSTSAISMPSYFSQENSSIQYNYHESKESQLQARPFFKITVNSPNQTDDNNGNLDLSIRSDDVANQISEEQSLPHNLELEEQQNIVNNEIAQQQESESPANSGRREHPSSILRLHITEVSSANQSSACNSNAGSCALPANIEETDNLLNEQNVAMAEIRGCLANNRNLSEQSDVPNMIIDRNEHLPDVINRILLPIDNVNEVAENHNNANIERELQDEELQFHQMQRPSDAVTQSTLNEDLEIEQLNALNLERSLTEVEGEIIEPFNHEDSSNNTQTHEEIEKVISYIEDISEPDSILEGVNEHSSATNTEENRQEEELLDMFPQAINLVNHIEEQSDKSLP